LKHEDFDIVSGLKKGENQSFEFFFKKYSKSLLRHIFRVVGNKEIAEDILNETSMTIIKKINFYNDKTDEGPSFKSWIFRIATNEAIDFIRKEKRRKKKLNFMSNEVEEVINHAPEFELQSIQEEVLLYKLMMELPTVQRTILNLKVKEEMSYLEISRVCGCSINSVKQALFKARANLRNKLKLCEVTI